MVAVAPPLPGDDISPLPPPPPEPAKVETVVVAERVSTVGRAYALLDTFTPEQQAELYIWLAGRPLPNVDPVRLALASTHALRDDELAIFFERLRESMDSELWELITTT